MVYRYLRTLEGVSPPLSLTHLSCQTTAKSFTATRGSISGYLLEVATESPTFQCSIGCSVWAYGVVAPIRPRWALASLAPYLDRDDIFCTVR